MQLFYKGQVYTGRRDVIDPAEQGLMGLSTLRLGSGEVYESQSGEYEIGLVILSGSADVAVDGQAFAALGKRANVFAGPAATVYIPRDSSYRVEGKSADFEAALCLVKADKKLAPFVVKPEEVVINHRGGQSWKRDVHDIIVDNGEGKVDKIVLGETYGDPGNWSSFPSHKHDQSIPGVETELTEIYYFRVKPENGFGVQILYTEDRELDEAFVIRDQDSVLIPKGYHPVVAPPSVQVYYLWFLAGSKGRKMQPHDDPQYKGLHALVK
ncbi:5-dehydro-4-deoxy-D-glucuronate isomerase [Acididesulfobacillus acetoxydans]|uniref:5-dehydro-4-deoxy-D-glucuronate isomerase n=1 Tax=Acididesulfobacillus acetoxydans TaxID=1561005 RepID=A0A8S0WRE0_9FIRM|nr:5-deoxy-glucuronate isomerase [Acididesulfobacillus acetoxydans]CAA7603244.1 5-dehydro-4-deoxy-D-glucuronate isomerase [Acididesulfobacillus acetoxydans]CEJ06041.1 5-deoxy-glucuronate isomerase [Acididesulfobacillus acetoxydans]